MKPILYPKKVSLGAGIVEGIVGGVVMYGMMAMLMTQIGMDEIGNFLKIFGICFLIVLI